MGKTTRELKIHSTTHSFTVGRDRRGRWTVCDDRGLIGGQFIDRASAIHFAMVESNYAPGAVHCLPDDMPISTEPVFQAGRKPVAATAGRRT